MHPQSRSMSQDHRRTSTFISLLLRHRPHAAGLVLDARGYVAVDALLAALAANGHALTRAGLDDLVATNDKQRFAYDATGMLIRAVQGHSVEVDLGLAPLDPPPLLYHGTVGRFLAAIRRDGLRPGSRRLVHLSGDVETARAVGRRRGTPVVLTIEAAAMRADGHEFHRAENGVWLTLAVPPGYITGWGEAG
jgi:putative RNA 2'-phosphotransferase